MDVGPTCHPHLLPRSLLLLQSLVNTGRLQFCLTMPLLASNQLPPQRRSLLWLAFGAVLCTSTGRRRARLLPLHGLCQATAAQRMPNGTADAR